MKDIKQEKTARLFRAFGEIDDVLLQEAYTYRPARRTVFSRAMLIAATLSLSVVLLLTGLLVTMQRNKGDLPPSNDAESNYGTQVNTLDQLLLDERDATSYTTLSKSEELPYFDGNVYLVWQYTDSDELCMSRALTQDEVDQLYRNMGKGSKVGDVSPALDCRVWVLCGNGQVLSPYLPLTNGNIGSAELFDYEAELIPSDKLVFYVAGILH